MAAALICPVCNAKRDAATGRCPDCGSDLSLLAAFDNQAPRHYSEALVLARDPATIDQAIEKLLLATGLDPQHVSSFVVLGKLYAQKEDFERAIAAFRRALELASASSEEREKARKGMDKAQQLLDRRKQEQEAARVQAARLARRRRIIGTGAVALGAWLIGIVVASFLLRRPPPPPPPPSPVAAVLQGVLSALPSALAPHLGAGKGRDLVDALAAARINVVPAGNGQVQLQGTVSVPEVKQIVETIASAAAGPGAVRAGGIEVRDEYIVYTIRRGDCPERIARRLCGTRRRLEEIRAFSPENQQTLQRMSVGSVLKIPKRLLVDPDRG
jgi:tetratricopeptide (TPR) repeat protein